MGKAFIDTGFYIHKMIVLKNFVLIADLHRSISLLKFQPKYTKLSFVAKDKRIIDAYACEYLVDNTNLAFICKFLVQSRRISLVFRVLINFFKTYKASDSEKNINVYMYQNESHDNQGGQWLIRKAEFNVGSHINSFFRLKCKVNDPHLDKRSSLADKRQVTYCCKSKLFAFFCTPKFNANYYTLFRCSYIRRLFGLCHTGKRENIQAIVYFAEYNLCDEAALCWTKSEGLSSAERTA